MGLWKTYCPSTSLLLSVITSVVLVWDKLASIGVQMGLLVILTIENFYRKPGAK